MYNMYYTLFEGYVWTTDLKTFKLAVIEWHITVLMNVSVVGESGLDSLCVVLQWLIMNESQDMVLECIIEMMVLKSLQMRI